MKRQARPKPNSHKLATHPLAKSVLDDLRPLLESQASGKDAETIQLGECVCYADNVFTHTSAMQFAIENLERSQHFIRSFPQPRHNVKRGVRQHDWIEYHSTIQSTYHSSTECLRFGSQCRPVWTTKHLPVAKWATTRPDIQRRCEAKRLWAGRWARPVWEASL